MRSRARNSILLAPSCAYVIRMYIGDLVKYWNLDGNAVFGIVTSDVFVVSKDTFAHPARAWEGEAIRVLWTDDGDETIERMDTLLDPMEEGIEFA